MTSGSAKTQNHRCRIAGHALTDQRGGGGCDEAGQKFLHGESLFNPVLTEDYTLRHIFSEYAHMIQGCLYVFIGVFIYWGGGGCSYILGNVLLEHRS